jgi:hypothetical protein
MYLTKQAIISLNQVFHLPVTGREQDWDLELADMNRVGEFVGYLAAHVLNNDEKRALMALIMSSLEDLSYEKTIPPGLWEEVKRQLQANPALYADVVAKWAGQEDDGFAISPLVRSLAR